MSLYKVCRFEEVNSIFVRLKVYSCRLGVVTAENAWGLCLLHWSRYLLQTLSVRKRSCGASALYVLWLLCWLNLDPTRVKPQHFLNYITAQWSIHPNNNICLFSLWGLKTSLVDGTGLSFKKKTKQLLLSLKNIHVCRFLCSANMLVGCMLLHQKVYF